MLNNRNLDDKTYEQLMAEALTQIPLYTGEWTNFNPSDPGITILENLTAFEILQQNQINQITPAIQKNLLKLAGFEAKKGRCARVLLEAKHQTRKLTFPVNQKFLLGDLCFETAKNTELHPCHLTGIYGINGEAQMDYSYLLDPEVRVPANIFGEQPAAGSSLWFTADSLPEAGEELIVYVTVADRYNRNPFPEKGNNAFAALKWECYTEQGFVEMKVKDTTGCFLVSGEIRMRLPGAKPAPCPQAPGGGFVIRATLERADYDVRPKLTSVSGLLFEVWQKETKAACYTFHRTSGIRVRSDLLKDGYLRVYCKEEKGSSYRLYEPYGGQPGKGRFYELIREEDDSYSFLFDKRRFGYGPEKLKNAVKILVYSEEMMRRFSLGQVLGYDYQTVSLPKKNIVPDNFCILVKRFDGKGEEIYDFVRPNYYDEDALTYRLYEGEGKIVIEDAGDYIGADLYLGALSVTAGDQGNVREDNVFEAVDFWEPVRFTNPKPGTGGCFHETLEEVKKRFLLDLKTPYVAVTREDYETLVRNTPQLCIDKVRAYVNENTNFVRIAVKPGTDEPFPKLSENYREAIEKQLEDKRLLGSKFQIVQPVYVAVNLRGTIAVKRQFENNRGMIEETVRRKLEALFAEKNFGEVLRFEEILRMLERLEWVELVYDLSLQPQNPGARLLESDIVPEDNVLCSVGEIRLQIGTDRRGN